MTGFLVQGGAPPDGSVSTAKILNDAVTLAKIAAGTDGELITWDASGDPAAVAVGTATHVLTSNGAGAAPTFQASGNAWNLIGTSVTSGSSATLDVTGLDTTYDMYAIGLSDLHPTTDPAVAWLRLGDSGGVDSGASDYMWDAIDTDGGTVQRGLDSSDDAIQIASTNDVGGLTGEGVCGMIYLSRGDGFGLYPSCTGTILSKNGGSTNFHWASDINDYC